MDRLGASQEDTSIKKNTPNTAGQLEKEEEEPFYSVWHHAEEVVLYS